MIQGQSGKTVKRLTWNETQFGNDEVTQEIHPMHR